MVAFSRHRHYFLWSRASPFFLVEVKRRGLVSLWQNKIWFWRSTFGPVHSLRAPYDCFWIGVNGVELMESGSLDWVLFGLVKLHKSLSVLARSTVTSNSLVVTSHAMTMFVWHTSYYEITGSNLFFAFSLVRIPSQPTYGYSLLGARTCPSFRFLFRCLL